MSVTASNLILGPGTLHSGTFGATEPIDSSINAAPAASAWSDVGGTQDGVKITIAQAYTELDVDQIVDVVGRRLTKREFMLETNLAEPTLENLAFALNETPPVSGSGYKTFGPTNASSATQPNYKALIFDGYAPGSYRRRLIGRKMLSTKNAEFAYTKDKQTVYTAQFDGHYVSESIKAFHIVDQTS